MAKIKDCLIMGEFKEETMELNGIYTITGKEVFQFVGEEDKTVKVAVMKNLLTGKTEKVQDVSGYKRLVIDGRQVPQKRTRKGKATLPPVVGSGGEANDPEKPLFSIPDGLRKKEPEQTKF